MFACPLIWFTLNLIFQIVQLSSAKAALEDSTREVTCKMRVICPPIEITYFSLTCGGAVVGRTVAVSFAAAGSSAAVS